MLFRLNLNGIMLLVLSLQKVAKISTVKNHVFNKKFLNCVVYILTLNKVWRKCFVDNIIVLAILSLCR